MLVGRGNEMNMVDGVSLNPNSIAYEFDYLQAADT